MKTKLLIGTLVFIILIAVIFLTKPSPTANIVDNSNFEEAKNSKENELITLDKLSQHDSEQDCWVVFEGRVYDLTDWISRHPGGKQKIAQTCGLENKFETDFKAQHGGTKVSLLMKVGTLIGAFDVVGEI